MKSMKFKNLAAAAGVAFTFAVASQTALAQDTVRVGLQQVPPDEVYKTKNWGEPYKLDVQLSSYSSAGNSLKAFLAGRVDIANGGAARLVTLALQQPNEFYIIAANQYGGTRYGLIVAANAPYKTIQDLKGKKIGAVTGSGTYNTFLLYLRRNGLSEGDFSIVNMKVEDLRAAVESGIIDAAVAWEPHVAIAETMGGAKRIASMDGINESPNFVLVRRSFAESHPAAVTKYVATLIDLATLIKTKPKEAGKLAAEQISKAGVRVAPAAMELALQRIKMDPEVKQPLLDELNDMAKSMLDSGKIKAMPDFAGLVRKEYFEKASQLASARK